MRALGQQVVNFRRNTMPKRSFCLNTCMVPLVLSGISSCSSFHDILTGNSLGSKLRAARASSTSSSDGNYENGPYQGSADGRSIASMGIFGPPSKNSNQIAAQQPGTKSRRLRHFINLTNGIEALPLLLATGIDEDKISFMRLQSSHCESNNFVGILQDLDHNLMMKLALGDVCLVYDFGSRGTAWPDGTVGIPRAVWWGLEWVRYALNRSWYAVDPDKVMLRGYNVKALFTKEYNMLPKTVRKKLRYYRPYLALGEQSEVQLHGVFRSTQIDGKTEEYLEIIKNHLSLDLGGSTSTINDNKNISSVSVPKGMQIFTNSKYEGIGRSGTGIH